jgi:hypothetical protein
MVDSSTVGTDPKGDTMRFLFKISIPVEAGNKAARDGFSIIAKILEQQKPEAAYFIAENGMRTGIVVMEMNDVSQLPSIAEPWFLGLNASIESHTRHDPRRPQKGGTGYPASS